MRRDETWLETVRPRTDPPSVHDETAHNFRLTDTLATLQIAQDLGFFAQGWLLACHPGYMRLSWYSHATHNGRNLFSPLQLDCNLVADRRIGERVIWRDCGGSLAIAATRLAGLRDLLRFESIAVVDLSKAAFTN